MSFRNMAVDLYPLKHKCHKSKEHSKSEGHNAIYLKNNGRGTGVASKLLAASELVSSCVFSTPRNRRELEGMALSL